MKNNTSVAKDVIYQKAFKYSTDLAYIIDQNCILIDCNNHLLKLFELSTVSETMPGTLYKMFQEKGIWTKEQTDKIKQTDIDVMLSGQPQLNRLELPSVNGDTITYYESSRFPLHDSDSIEADGLLVVLKDITKAKSLTTQLERMKEQLQSHNSRNFINHHEQTESAKKNTPPKILIVEDNAIAQKAARSILLNNDCLVDIAADEISFRQLFSPGKYDLVFMDIGLENTSGYIMAKQLRKQEENTGFHVPIIALTGYEADVVRFDCDYYEMDGVITKPLTPEQVKQIIQHYIFHINLEITGLKSLSQRRM